MSKFEDNILQYLKEIKRLTNYTWFSGETPQDIYVENFGMITKEFENNFSEKLSKHSHYNLKSTMDSIGSLDLN